MADIHVTRTGGDAFRVEIREEDGSSTHQVTVSGEALRRYGGGASAEDLLEASFEFLLEREPRDSILSRFDLPVIERYFPEYPDEIRSRLA